MEQFETDFKDTSYDVFWEVNSPKKGQVVVSIFPDKLIEFCSKKLGFYNFVDYSGNYLLVRLSRGSIIEVVKPEDIKQEIKKYLRDVKNEEDVWAEFAKRNWITENFRNLLEKIPEINFNLSTKTEAYYFFRNTVAKVNTFGISFINYEDFKGTVWKGQIIDRDFKPMKDAPKAVFNQFLKNICNQDKERYYSLISIIGYLLHPYKDPSETKAIILIDEKIDSSGKAFGGTGKSVIAQALGQITPTVWKDGKKYNPNEVFVFDDIRPHHRLLYFDDVKKNFPFEEFYSLITGNLKINRKYQDSTLIPFSLTPKLLISSNYMVMGTGGTTDERRRIDFELYPYYTMDKRPKDEFGHIFFDEWSIEEWQLFYSLMLGFVNYFIQNGIKYPPQINVKENRLKVQTDHEFVIFMDGTIQLGVAYDKAQLLNDFIEVSPKHRNLSKIQFKWWIDDWAFVRGYISDNRKSNGKAIVRFDKIN